MQENKRVVFFSEVRRRRQYRSSYRQL